MSGDRITLRQILSQQKPAVACNMTSKRNTIGTSWPKLKGSVTIWEDFNFDNLNESYGHVLDFPIQQDPFVHPQVSEAFPNVAIEKDDDINHLISWNDRVMQPALRFAKSYLGLYPGIVIRHKYSTANKSFQAKIPSATSNIRVSHVIALDDFPGPNLVAGLGRSSSK
ncbi:hypothetical protein ACHAPJ_009836 [Fusarium lateritium]